MANVMFPISLFALNIMVNFVGFIHFIAGFPNRIAEEAEEKTSTHPMCANTKQCERENIEKSFPFMGSID